MFLDIVILPPADISRAVGKLTAKLARGFPLRMRVDNKKLYPHISLYHLLVPRGRVKTVVAEVSRLVAEQKQIPIIFQKVRGGKVYFGKLDQPDSPEPILKDVFYITLGQTRDEFRLNKLTGQDNPKNELTLSRDHILYWEPLEPDSKVMQGIEEFHKQQK